MKKLIAAVVACAGCAGGVFAQCPGAPTIDADLGTLTPGTPLSTSVLVTGTDVHWFKFTTTSSVDMASLTFIDITNSGSTPGGTGTSVDSELGLFACDGTLVATDDDDAEGLVPALSFGSGSALQMGTGGVWSNGRDGRLPAGEYYVSVSLFNSTFANGFSVTSTSTNANGVNCTLSLTMGTATAMADPAGTIDLGVMGNTDVRTRDDDALNASEVRWYKVAVPHASLESNRFLDIDTENSLLSPTNATRIAVYNTTGVITGTLNPTTRLNTTTGLNDTVDGTGSLSQVSLGVGLRPAPGNGVAYNGRDGNLQAGTYLIGIAGPGTAPSAVGESGSNFGLTSTSANAGTIDLRVATGEGAISLIVTGNTVTAQELSTVLLRATVTPANPPPSTGIAVTGDLSGIGGSATQQFFDDGTNGDVAAGDNIYSYSYTLPISILTGAYPLPVTATDAQSRTASGTLNLTVSNGPTGACCATDNTCSTTRATLCAQASGAFQGVGTNCGGEGYTFASSTSTFEDISLTGSVLGTVSGCDDCVEAVTIPFTFSHMGNAYGGFTVSSNGNIQFSTASTLFTNATIPNAAVPNDMLAPAWDDYNPGVAGDVYMLVDGVSPNQRCVVSWQAVTQFGTTDSNDFQVVLFENGNVEFRYGVVNNMLTAGDVTVGYENIDGSFGGQYDSSLIGTGSTALLLTTSTIPSPCTPLCDTVDFNGDGLFPDTQDITDFIFVYGGGPCPTGTLCGDIDYNNDGLFPDTLDISALISVFAGGDCLR
jgi:hypothetical protein